MIGGYELAWLVDIVASYLLDNLEDILVSTYRYHGTYINDGIIYLIEGGQTKILQDG